MPASKASNDFMVTLSSPEPERGVMNCLIKAMVFTKFQYVVSLNSVFFITSHIVGTIESLYPSFRSAIYRTIELAGGLNGRIICT